MKRDEMGWEEVQTQTETRRKKETKRGCRKCIGKGKEKRVGLVVGSV